MEIQAYFDKMKSIYQKILDYIENSTEENQKNLYDILNIFKVRENPHDIKSIVYILQKISFNHYRAPNFYPAISQIIIFIKDEIKQTFSNSELFNLFKDSKRSLLLLLEHQLVIFNESMLDTFASKKYVTLHYYSYFFPELKELISKPMCRKYERELPEDFEEKRNIGENDDFVCQLIRKDSIEEFILYVNKNHVDIQTNVKNSFFETNTFLSSKDITLIEYAAFFGSIKIVKYLIDNGVKMKPNLWLFAVHSNEIEMIKFLKESHLIPEDNSFERCIEEAIKCHHNEMANYIRENLLNKNEERFYVENNFNKNIINYAFHFFNYAFFPSDAKNRFIFYYACYYDHFTIVNIFLQQIRIYVYAPIVKISFFFFCFKWNFL